MSRVFMSLLLCASLFAWRKRPTVGRKTERIVYLLVGLGILLNFVFFAFVPLQPVDLPSTCFTIQSSCSGLPVSIRSHWILSEGRLEK